MSDFGNHTPSEKEKRKSELAREVLTFSRDQLIVSLRFLDAAISRLKPLEAGTPFMCDGESICYSADEVLSLYMKERNVTARNYLHMVFHCIFRHMFVSPAVDRDCWNLACDIAVENIIRELDISCVSAEREDGQRAVSAALQRDIGQLTAEKIYRYLLDHRDGNEEWFQRLAERFRVDRHDIWYMTATEKRILLVAGSDKKPGAGGKGTDGEALEELDLAEIKEEWEKVAAHVEEDLKTFSKSRGNLAGSLLQNLREVNREKYDYTEFLKKFAVRNEAMKINDDEFDYIYYTYGLQTYGNVPLVEPLEYKEVKQIREFVIAIDTSGSVMGEEVQSFIQKTYNILKNTESFVSRINLHIIQCDAKIAEHVKITSQEEFDEYLKHMTIKGLGGTDFRPVFEEVDRLIAEKEFFNLKGLIYFTDGYGKFPEKKPDYETAFVFVNDDVTFTPEVPSWAIKLVLKKEEPG